MLWSIHEITIKYTQIHNLFFPCEIHSDFFFRKVFDFRMKDITYFKFVIISKKLEMLPMLRRIGINCNDPHSAKM